MNKTLDEQSRQITSQSDYLLTYGDAFTFQND